MLIAETMQEGSSAGESRRFGVIGTCRVHNPMRCLIEAEDIRLVWREFNAFTHGPMEAIQYLQFVRGELPIPDYFAPFIFRTDETPPTDQKLRDTMRELDFLIVEISSFSRLNCGAYEFQQNYFSENFIRRGGADYLGWWRDVTQGKPGTSAAEDLVALKAESLKLHEEEVIRTLRFDNLSDEAFLNGLRSLTDIADLPLILVPHFSFDNEDNPISALRARNRRLVQQVADEEGHRYFDPSPHLMDYGRVAALKNEGRDLYHYSPEFDAHMGDIMLDMLQTPPATTGTTRAAAG